MGVAVLGRVVVGLGEETGFRVHLEGGGWWDYRNDWMSVQGRLLSFGGMILLDHRLTVGWRPHCDIRITVSSRFIRVECGGLVLWVGLRNVVVQDRRWRWDITAMAAFRAQRFFVRLVVAR